MDHCTRINMLAWGMFTLHLDITCCGPQQSIGRLPGKAPLPSHSHSHVCLTVHTVTELGRQHPLICWGLEGVICHTGHCCFRQVNNQNWALGVSKNGHWALRIFKKNQHWKLELLFQGPIYIISITSISQNLDAWSVCNEQTKEARQYATSFQNVGAQNFVVILKKLLIGRTWGKYCELSVTFPSHFSIPMLIIACKLR